MLGAGLYFYHVAVVPGPKSFLSKKTPLKKTDPLYHQKLWFEKVHKTKWTMKSAGGDYKLVADYIPAAKKSNKTVLIAHGFNGSKEDMGAYAYLFHELGYNVVARDARGQGQSQGDYIGYGWPDRLDDKKWIKKIIAKNPDSKIVMFGVSMGGATTMMVSGEHLPHQVKAFIEDCGYTNVKTEINYQAEQLYHLPTIIRVPLVDIVSLITRVRAGYFFGQASSVKQLAKNKRPMLFIHGTKDKFVPTKMIYANYRATNGPKEMWLVKGAGHARSYQTKPKAYEQHVKAFLDKYVH
ncbi:alpha/beta hydrolase [Paucilactobacillus suebicus]|nr:alpha/beta hydrolase [Paucilactobacillus suebicus]